MESEIVLDESGYRKKDEATVQHGTEQPNTAELPPALLGLCDVMAGSHVRDK